MTTDSRSRVALAARWLPLAGAAIGVLGLAGWLLDARAVTTLVPGRPPMVPNTALALMALGSAAAMTPAVDGAPKWRAIVRTVLLVSVLLMAVPSGAEYVLGQDYGIDRWLLDIDTGGAHPGRPSPVTLATLTLLGLAGLASLRTNAVGARAALACSLAAVFLAFFSLVAHLFGAGEFYQLRSSPVTGVALPTAIALLLVAAGMVLSRADSGIVQTAVAGSVGGTLVRRLGLVAVIGIPLLGVASYYGMLAAGLHDLPLTLALLTTLGVPVTLGLLLVTAQWLDRAQSALTAAEESTRRSQARLEGIIGIAADAIISVDESGTIVMYNQGAARIFGWTQDEALGRPLDVLLPARSVTGHHQHVRAFGHEAAVARMMSERQRVVGRRKNGDEFPAEAAISKLQQDGRWIYTVILRDTTRTAQLEGELRRSADRFRFLADVSSLLSTSLADRTFLSRVAELVVEKLAACCSIEIEAPSARLVVHCRHGGAAEPAGHDGRVLTVSAPTLCREATAETWRTFVAAPALEYPLGSTATSLIAVPILDGGHPIGALVMLSAPERRYDDADLQAAIELARRIGMAVANERLYHDAQAATRARDEMLGIVAHDLRSPLNAVQFGADALAQQVPADRRVSTQKAVQAIQRSIRHATRLVDDLLDVARIEAGQLQLMPRELSLNTVLAEVAESFSSRAAAAGVTLTVDADPGRAMMLADDDRLHQALSNLIDNAIKFTPGGGHVHIGLRHQHGEYRVVVADTGPGIPAEHLPRLFDRFWQARASRRGAGLGLAIVKGIVEAHGGRIWADSTPGRGTTFTITLPDASRRAAGVSGGAMLRI